MKGKNRLMVHPASVSYWTRITWKLANAVLWPEGNLKPSEVRQALKNIRQYYSCIPPEKFIELAPQYFDFLRRQILFLGITFQAKDILPSEVFTSLQDIFHTPPAPYPFHLN